MKQRKKTPKHAALLILIIISALLCTAWSLLMRSSLYADYDIDLKQTPSLVLMMNGIREGVYPWDAKFEIPEGSFLNQAKDRIQAFFDKDQGNTTQTGVDKTVAETPSEIPSEIPSEPDSGLVPEPMEPISLEPLEFTTVDDTYFDDALFIGDSRMVGLSEYCEPIYSRADFYVKRSMTIYQLLDGKEVKFNKENKTLWEVLDEKQYGKIYIQVGINEIGTGTPEYFQNAYSQVLTEISVRQPNAIIFVNSIMHVTDKMSRKDKLYNNPNINARNAVLEPFADNIHIFYIDVNENIDDANGGMRQDYSYDDIHLLGSCYEPFHRTLLTHGIVKNE